MKIIYGKYRQSKILTVKNSKMRPTQGRAKAVIFNWLAINSDDVVWDLFAGTGSLGLEALSLGAKKVIFNDSNCANCLFIKKTLQKLKIDSSEAIVFNCDFRTFLRKKNDFPTIIFFDPPFIAEKYYQEGLKYIFKNKILDNKGVIVLEKPKKMNILELKLFKIYKYKKLGEKELLILKK